MPFAINKHRTPTPRIETTSISVSEALLVNWKQIQDLAMISMRPPITDTNSILAITSERTTKAIITEFAFGHLAMREIFMGRLLDSVVILQKASRWILSIVWMEGVMLACF
jgi:hypothetical protein